MKALTILSISFLALVFLQCSGGRNLPEPYPLNTDYLVFEPSSQCNCEYIINDQVENFDANNVPPGSHVCFNGVTSPHRGPIRLLNLKGKKDQPIVIRNCGALVNITSNDHRPAIYAEGVYFRLSGTGSESDDYGFVLSAANAAQAISIGKSSHFEIDHVHIVASNFAGIMAKVDPSSEQCQVGDRRFDDYIMKHVHIHQNKIEHVAGEAIYVGNSFYNGTRTQYCLANQSCPARSCAYIQFPHEVLDVYIWQNTLSHIGWDGIQVGSAIHNCFIHQNAITYWAEKQISGQNHGIQIGQGSSCQVSQNTLINGEVGMHISGLGNSLVQNNQLLNFRLNGLYVNPIASPLKTDIKNTGFLGGFQILNNTFTSSLSTAPVIRDVRRQDLTPPTSNNLIHNNTIDTTSDPFQLSEEYAWDLKSNVIVP